MCTVRVVIITGNLRFRILALGAMISLLFFFLFSYLVFSDLQLGGIGANQFDQWFSQSVKQLRNPPLTQVMSDLTALGSLSAIVVYLVLLRVVLRSKKVFAFIAVVALGGKLLPTLLKLLFNRERPLQTEWLLTNVTQLSFPSGHSFGAAAAYLGFAYCASLYTKSKSQEILYYTLAAMFILIIGFSRIYLGVHFPTDVLAGISGGTAWALGLSAVYEKFFR